VILVFLKWYFAEVSGNVGCAGGVVERIEETDTLRMSARPLSSM
jgi:hypothetical protein